MSPLAALGYWLADRADTRTGYPFTTHPPASAGPAAPGSPTPAHSVASTAALAGEAGEPTENPPSVGAGLPNSRPGAGRHANNCVYIDDPWHRCVDESGQPANTVCHASETRQRRLPKEVA